MKITDKKVAIIAHLNNPLISKRRRENLNFLAEYYNKQGIYLDVVYPHEQIYCKEYFWNVVIKNLPDYVEYVFLSDADVIETPKFNLLQKSLDAIVDNNWDGMQCFTNVRYLSLKGTQDFIAGKDFNCFSFLRKTEKAGVNGGKACGGLLLFKKEYLQKVPLIDYCLMGSGDTINMSVWMPHDRKLPHEELYNAQLWQDILERRDKHPIRFGALPATLLHLYHRSPSHDNYLLRNAYIFQIYKPDIWNHLDDLLPLPSVKNMQEYEVIKESIKGINTIRELVLNFNKLREERSGEDPYQFLYLHENKPAYTVSEDNSPRKVNG